MQLPQAVREIIETLERAGFEAYAVGGCVRDTLLSRTPNDWDITTNAKPEEVKALFNRTIDTGIEHGTVTVRKSGESYEVTTFRIDGKYKDSRHPESVEFTPNLEEDLKRRDFTINAMAYSDKTGVVDLFGGEEDLKNGIVRAVGVPLERFTEDALRIMRCVRFAAQLGFSIEEETHKAAKALSPTLRIISAERIREELLKTLESDHPEMVSVLDEIGALSAFYPEYREKKTVLEDAVVKVPKNRVLRLAAFLYQSGKDLPDSYRIADRVLNELKFDNETHNAVLHMIRFHDVKLTTDRAMLRRFLNTYGKEGYKDLITFMETASGLQMDSVRAVLEDIEAKGECTALKEMAICGKDLIGIGMLPGKEMGETLMALLADVLEDPSLNTREILLERAKARREKA